MQLHPPTTCMLTPRLQDRVAHSFPALCRLAGRYPIYIGLGVAHITVLRLGCELQQFELQSKNHRISDFLKVPTGRAVFECI